MAFEPFFEEKTRGVFREVSGPTFGSQDVGISPGGAMDQFALECGNALLGNPLGSPALEILIPPVLTVTKSVLLALTGAVLPRAMMELGDTSIPLEPGTVYLAHRGTRLRCGSRKVGVWSYLCFRDAEAAGSLASIVGRSLRGLAIPGEQYGNQPLIRVIDGPDLPVLSNPDAFFSTTWTVARDSNEMGMRLTSSATLTATADNMVSEAVSTGTVQLTPAGPIILLRRRQTVGGYPRIYAVISADIDPLTQCPPGRSIAFQRVTIDEAWAAARRKVQALASLRSRFF